MGHPLDIGGGYKRCREWAHHNHRAFRSQLDLLDIPASKAASSKHHVLHHSHGGRFRAILHQLEVGLAAALLRGADTVPGAFAEHSFPLTFSLLSPALRQRPVFRDFFLSTAAALAAAVVALPRAKRAAYELPDGVEFLVGSVKTSFQCPVRNRYFADVDNNCQIFHVCSTIPKEDGSVEVQQYSFLCGNQTVFNQFSLTCSLPEDSVPCRSSQDFFYLNERIGQEKVAIHDVGDIQRAVPLIPRYQQAGLAAPFFKG
ncbi:uncharacterized protein LOC135378472 [Ornithodoros turicata]|uniref:uncharacterized protein LOC135378472 n=1 Tax=Ornithodoros turicata TaxID=34597 RepID=UPI0031393907